ncbi:MAG: hypothetical protein U9R60_15400 [Bacteroidota bacterium]|nr:hypothetical protein [Bacteroidota bacterium]
MSEKSGYWVPFPGIPESTRAKYSINGLFLRPFGLFENDLEIDFNQKLHPYLVTQILECCTRGKNGETPEKAFFWDLTIGKRIECVLAIVMSGRASRLPIHLRCLNQTCQEPMEIEFSLEEMAALQYRSDDAYPFVIQIDSRNLQFRKPTGSDQLEWLKGSFPDEDAAIKRMIQTLLCNDEKAGSDHEFLIPDEWVKTIDEAMAEIDPLVNFSLTIYCPHCDEDGLYTINLEESLLHELHKAQKNLIATIHRLAAHYHWSEQQVLSIPPWRRFHYLALIEKEEA